MEINITEEILYFTDFLDRNWNHFIEKLQTFKYRDEWQREDLLNDWLQFNWEILLESSVCKDSEFLTGYGLGSECNLDSDRVRYPNKKATHTIKCTGKLGDTVFDSLAKRSISIVNLEFFKFTSLNKSSYSDVPPFDSVLMQDDYGEYYSFQLKDIDFYKVALHLDI